MNWNKKTSFIDKLVEPGNLIKGVYITIFILALATRLLIPSQPEKNLVFDESYFVPQVESYVVNRYFYDPHPPLAKMLMYYGTIIVNPDAADLVDGEKLGNKVDDYKSPLDLRGIRLMPRIAGTFVPLVVAAICFQMLQAGRKRISNPTILTTFAVGIVAVFSNILIVESRFALQTQILLLFMLLSVWGLLKYFNSRSYQRAEIWYVVAAIFFGLSISVKWLALSGLSVFVILVLYKEITSRAKKSKWWQTGVKISMRFALLGLVAITTYASIFVWHFHKMQTYSPAADETSVSHQEDLKNGTRNTAFASKFVEWHQLALKYEKYVPELDYSKDDEIGSMWVTWPMMARPISYYWQTDGDGLYDFVYLIGNPAAWLLSLVGVLGLSALGFARLFQKNQFNIYHFAAITLYFANWLPYALITRVMYLYHYVPAFVFGLICAALLVQDFVYPRVKELLKKFNKKFYSSENVMFLFGILGLVIIMASFFWFSPFTYLLPLSQEDFESRVILKEWNMEWPG